MCNKMDFYIVPVDRTQNRESLLDYPEHVRRFLTEEQIYQLFPLIDSTGTSFFLDNFYKSDGLLMWEEVTNETRR